MQIVNKSNLSNPYTSDALGKKEWNDRYMNMAIAIRNWQIAFFVSIVMSLVLALVVGKIATESHVQPYIVQTNNGMPLNIQSMVELSSKDKQTLAYYAVSQFIENARTVITDNDAQKTLVDKVYAYAADDSLNYLKDFYENNNPLLINSKYTVSVNNVTPMLLSNNTWQVTWDETKRDITSGELISTSRYLANLSYQFGNVNSKFITENPFGLYITQMSWSQIQDQ
jgi:type IV secretion system protein VirB5